ncbi:MAG: phosphoglycerate transporter protein PgtP [Sodaliphilus sp.]|jgi:OPA family glycerol-3-phosphate transporter-like MFS transporter|nr:phosphoglycerate transporter protein PgtP [Muribaculaceae bacterium]MCI6145991.1 phosphoglycerate transporter protein PgtP [Bacteroidales bacterium]MDY2671865.1 phosphoglycerate transporter protein PgtP [Sodaliphilus sp.]HAO63184.1 glycerol-3-phosphate transporter [Porphyromonadaceae bacterium]MCI6293245.1 phosphoglycerate transporter protein PgtP [Bacteroidales bacterium]
MASFLAPPAARPAQTGPEADAKYKKLRWQVFIGIFIGYAGFYLVRKNFSMAIPMLAPFGFEKGELGIVLSMNAIAYGFSKFVMASISDRSNAQRFLPLGLVCTAISMLFMIVPVQWLGAEHKGAAIALMAVLNFLVGWFNGMGWPPCGRVMTHWFSIKERGTWMSFWNCAHNVGGALVGPMAVYGAMWFGSWFYGANTDYYFLIGTYAFPAAVAVLVAVLAYLMIRDTPQSCGLQSIEEWSGHAAKNYSKADEKALSVSEIFKTVLSNKLLWYIAFANAFVYMVRYGCLDWAPTILKEQGVDLKEAGWAYFAYEMAAIPGTIFCGWLSDKVFQGRRALPTIIFMALVAVAIVVYWQFFNNFTVVICCLIAIGFLIYGPVMLIGVQALDLAPKNAAGTAAGLTGFMGYVLGTAILANVVIGYVAENAGWDWTFILLLIACALSVFFMALTYKEEKYLAEQNKN